MSIVLGHDLRIFSDAAAAATYVAIAKAISCSIKLSMSPIEIAHKDTPGNGSGWGQLLAGEKTATFTCSALYAEGDDLEDLFDDFANDNPVAIQFKRGTSGDKFFQCLSCYIIDIEQNADEGDKANYSVTLRSNAEVTRETVP